MLMTMVLKEVYSQHQSEIELDRAVVLKFRRPLFCFGTEFFFFSSVFNPYPEFVTTTVKVECFAEVFR